MLFNHSSSKFSVIGFPSFLDHLRIIRNDRSRNGEHAYDFVHDISSFLQYQSERSMLQKMKRYCKMPVTSECSPGARRRLVLSMLLSSTSFVPGVVWMRPSSQGRSSVKADLGRGPPRFFAKQLLTSMHLRRPSPSAQHTAQLCPSSFARGLPVYCSRQNHGDGTIGLAI